MGQPQPAAKKISSSRKCREHNARIDGILEGLSKRANEIDRLRAALEEIASGLSVRDPFHIANEALGRAVTE